MQRWTERQLLVALVWLGLQWNKPDRGDHYLMQIHQAMKQVFSKNASGIKLKSSKIKFKYGRPKKKSKEEEDGFYTPGEVLRDIQRSMAMGQSTLPVTIRRVSKDGTRILSQKQVDPRTGQVIPGTEISFSD